MDASSPLEKLRHLMGDLGWRLYVWGHFGGDEERFRREMEADVRRREAERFQRERTNDFPPARWGRRDGG